MSENTNLEFFNLELIRKTEVAQDTWLFEFSRPDRALLPTFEAGSHVTVVTPSGARRQYSLCGDQVKTDTYMIAIKAEREGRGASISMVDDTSVGDRLDVSTPENTFPMVDANDYLFIAGGIGITPILSMIRQLKRSGHTAYRLIYVARDRSLAAFADDLETLGGDRVMIHCDEGQADNFYDFWPLFETPGKSHVYCCGPRPLMEEIKAVSGHWSPERMHFEDFASDVRAIRDNDTAFTVRHADTGEEIQIPADATILETLRDKGHALPSSCESGTCGTCRTELVEGEADHRDMVLEEHQRDSYIMICVSRALSDKLVLRW
ncbi:MAG: ferredoxin [marine bacterium B5-7]|nr:MAG: ferredoxin [marine bacterium B5-7]